MVAVLLIGLVVADGGASLRSELNLDPALEPENVFLFLPQLDFDDLASLFKFAVQLLGLLVFVKNLHDVQNRGPEFRPAG